MGILESRDHRCQEVFSYGINFVLFMSFVVKSLFFIVVNYTRKCTKSVERSKKMGKDNPVTKAEPKTIWFSSSIKSLIWPSASPGNRKRLPIGTIDRVNTMLNNSFSTTIAKKITIVPQSFVADPGYLPAIECNRLDIDRS